jgi:ABC-type multidrug transport system ATPase subunit
MLFRLHLKAKGMLIGEVLMVVYIFFVTSIGNVVPAPSTELDFSFSRSTSFNSLCCPGSPTLPDHCVDFAYAPNDDATNTFVTQMLSAVSPHCNAGQLHILSFPNALELHEFVADDGKGRTAFAMAAHGLDSVSPSIVFQSYTTAFGGSAGMSSPLFSSSGAADLLSAATEALIGAQTGAQPASIDFAVTKQPVPSAFSDTEAETTNLSSVSICLVLALLLPGSSIAAAVGGDKESGLLAVLRARACSMGGYLFAQIAAGIVDMIVVLVTLVACLFATGMLAFGDVATGQLAKLVFCSLLGMLPCLAFALFTPTVSRTTQAAGALNAIVVVVVTCFSSAIPVLFLYGAPLWSAVAVMLVLPQSCLAMLFSIVAYTSNPALVVLLPPGYSLSLFICATALSGLFWFFIAWYGFFVFPQSTGAPEKPLFFATRSFWRPAPPANPSLQMVSSHLLPADQESEAFPVTFRDVGKVYQSRKAESKKAAKATKAAAATSESTPLLGSEAPATAPKRARGRGRGKTAPVRPRIQALDSLSFRARSGMVLALLGFNGSGKSSSMKIITGEESPTSGEVFVAGVSASSPQAVRNVGVGICPQTNALWETATVHDQLTVMAKIASPRKSPAEIEAEVSAALDTLEMGDHRDKLNKQLSGGMKRCICTLQAFFGQPRIVCLDEATTGMDAAKRRLVWKYLQTAKSSNMCIIVTTHQMDEAEMLGDTVAILSKGKLLAGGTTAFLLDRFGSGYTMNIIGANAHAVSGALRAAPAASEEDRALQAALEVKDESSLDAAGTVGCVLSVPKGQERLIPSVLRALEAMETASAALSVCTLDDVFVTIAGFEGAEVTDVVADSVQAGVF